MISAPFRPRYRDIVNLTCPPELCEDCELPVEEVPPPDVDEESEEYELPPALEPPDVGVPEELLPEAVVVEASPMSTISENPLDVQVMLLVETLTLQPESSYHELPS